MKLSARNDLKATVVEIVRGPIMAKVKMDVGGQILTAVISAEAVDELGLQAGDPVHAIIKSTEVIVGK